MAGPAGATDLAIAVVVISYALLETVPYHPTWEWTPLGGGVVLGANPHTLWFVPITIACTLLMPHVSYRHRDTNAAVTTER